MLKESEIGAQLKLVLEETNFSFLGKRYAGKVRDNYTLNKRRFLITSDRISCFDRILTTVPFKGQVLTELAAFWFKASRSVVKNHLIDMPDPNVMVVHECEVLPIEVVVREYLTGSAWRDYQAGRPISGVTLPSGLRMSEKLPERTVTPSTKAQLGEHDLPISEQDIVARGIVPQKLWQQIREVSLALFDLGSREIAKRGLLLVDTKYEFGLYNGELMLVDEIHTLDCSRIWVAKEYQQHFLRGEPQEMLDKEPVRQWLLQRGFKGDGPVPEIGEDYRIALALHYMQAFERITGTAFNAVPGAVLPRIEGRLREYVKS